MEGILISLDRQARSGKVDTRNDRIGVLPIYFGSFIPNEVQQNCSVTIDIRRSSSGNLYARFISVVERNKVIFNTEDRDQWYTWGED